LNKAEAQFGPFFLGMIPVEGWKVGQAYKRAIGGGKPAAFTELIELTHRLFEDYPAISQGECQRPLNNFLLVSP
jgi:hypothetical protein